MFCFRITVSFRSEMMNLSHVQDLKVPVSLRAPFQIFRQSPPALFNGRNPITCSIVNLVWSISQVCKIYLISNGLIFLSRKTVLQAASLKTGRT